MTAIQLDLDDRLVRTMGVQTVKAFMERQLSMLYVRYLGEKIARTIRLSEFDHEKEAAEARQDAWQEYKAKYLSHL